MSRADQAERLDIGLGGGPACREVTASRAGRGLVRAVGTVESSGRGAVVVPQQPAQSLSAAHGAHRPTVPRAVKSRRPGRGGAPTSTP